VSIEFVITGLPWRRRLLVDPTRYQIVSRQRGRKSGASNATTTILKGVVRSALQNQMLRRSFCISPFGLRDGITTVRRVACAEGMFRLPKAVFRCGLVASDVFAVNAIGRPDATKY
jgi:hypothetical protein